MSKNTPPSDNDLLNWPVPLLEIVTLDKGGELSSLSPDTIKRNHADKVIKLSDRRVGIRVGHALMLGHAAKK